MAASSADHALIVAGPSGAGKSTFIRDLAARRLPVEIAEQLPALPTTWRVVCSTTPDAWEPLLNGSDLRGVILHYDITSMWFLCDGDLARDPFWAIVDRCRSATLVVIRPTRHRLIAQWCHSHQGTKDPRRVVWNRMRAAVAALAMTKIRRFRRPMGDPDVPRWRYPRPLRFLKHVDRTLRAARVPRSIRAFDLYRTRGRLAEMMHAWDQTASARLQALSVKRIEIAPDPLSEIGQASGWRMIGVADMTSR